MKTYYFKGKNYRGRVITGFYRAENKSDVAKIIRKKGYFPVEIKKQRLLILWDMAKKLLKLNKKQVNHKKLMIFCRQFSTMLGSGVTLKDSLDVIYHQTTDKSFSSIIYRIKGDIQKGKLLSEALRTHGDILPQIMVSMVEAGEISGNLSSVFGILEEHFKKNTKLREKIKNLSIYPSILIGISIIVLFFIVYKVIPSFESILSQMGTPLPKITLTLMKISRALNSYKLFVFPGMLMFILLIKKYYSNLKVRKAVDYLIFKLPVVGNLIKQVILLRFSSVFYLMLRGGVPILQSLEIIQKVIDNECLRQEISAIIHGVKKGSSISDSLKNSRVFPPMVIEMIKVGEESGNLGKMMAEIEAYYEIETRLSMERFSAVIEPVLVVFMALVIGFIVYSVMLPMFEIYSIIG